MLNGLILERICYRVNQNSFGSAQKPSDTPASPVGVSVGGTDRATPGSSSDGGGIGSGVEKPFSAN